VEGKGDRTFDPESILEMLNEHRVRYIVIGGIAAILQGSPFPTLDLDICADTNPENMQNLATALCDLDAKEWDPRKDIEVPRTWDTATLSVDKTWILRTRYGALDVLFKPAGTRGFSDLRRREVAISLEELEVGVAAVEDLIRMKEAAGRRRDLEQLPTLRKLEQRLKET